MGDLMTAVHDLDPNTLDPNTLDPNTIDEATGKTLAEMEAIAEDLYAHRHEIMAESEEVPFEHSPDVRSVVSVRLNQQELDHIAAAARSAGVPLSAYIRSAALTSAAAIDLDAVRRELAATIRALTELDRALGDRR
jgi:predicted DNA binding CopG/RHH family protein